MKLRIYSVHDSKAAAYTQPFFFVNDHVAIRAVLDVLRQPDHQWVAHPGDYRVVELGEWDDNTGEISDTGYRLVADMSSLVVSKPVSSFIAE